MHQRHEHSFPHPAVNAKARRTRLPGASQKRVASAHAPGEHGQHVGLDKHAGHGVAMFPNKFWIVLALTLPTLVWRHMLQRVLGYAAYTSPVRRG